MKLCTLAANSRPSFVDFVSVLNTPSIGGTGDRQPTATNVCCSHDTGTSPVFCGNLDDGHKRDDVYDVQTASKIMPTLFTNTPPRRLSRAETLAKHVGHSAVFAFRSPFCQLDERARYKVGQPQVNTESLSFKNEKSIALSLGRR